MRACSSPWPQLSAVGEAAQLLGCEATEAGLLSSEDALPMEGGEIKFGSYLHLGSALPSNNALRLRCRGKAGTRFGSLFHSSNALPTNSVRR